MGISAKVETRIAGQIKKYLPILDQAKQRDISESDTSLIVCEILTDVLGYNKFENITTEHNIRGTYVDLAVQIDGTMRFLVEVKAIGIPLKDHHVKQAIDYAANKGTEWVILTNGTVWRVYNVQFSQPIEKILICEIDLLSTRPKSPEVLECFGNLSREEFSKETMTEFLQQKEIASKFAIASVLLTETMIDELRKEIRRLSGIRIETDYLRETLLDEVIKRELIDSEEGQAAQALVKRYLKAEARTKRASDEENEKPESSATLPVAEISPSASVDSSITSTTTTNR
jgi:hypothetical protein